MEIVYRTLIVLLAGYLFLRVTGKKAVSQMHTFDLLYIFVLTNIISTPVEDSNLGKAIIYGVITVILYKIFIRLSIHNKLRWILYESPTVLIRNGDIDRKGLKKVRMPINELLSHLRVKGYTDTRNIALAVMEETGSISVIPKSKYRPVQPNDLKLTIKKEYIPIPLIMDGQIIYHNLKYLKLEQGWLMNEVKKLGEKVENIMLATFLDNGKLFIDNNEIKSNKNNPYYYNPGEDN
ncbi:DUF421 domain-containing protein [Bacillus salipaludis]|uniref:DUF421 domain-containing protein n=1 Tax=Bacillus salipaludis TaxID=2547811 RepID=A0A4R5VVI6_9BACI|nr:DUF421 domain-containing protein [Bacillus salipaludis]MDQ6597337.1 DUF421 domain-containing protein [Bacillus salipaludis]TDK63228.1 DUF421 domain-containing protein [Bacillus salipaludis]